MWSDEPCGLSNERCRCKKPRGWLDYCWSVNVRFSRVWTVDRSYQLTLQVTLWCSPVYQSLSAVMCHHHLSAILILNTGTLNTCKNLIMLESAAQQSKSVCEVEKLSPWDFIKNHFISTMWQAIAMFYASVILLVGWHTARPPLTIWLKASVARGHALPYGAPVAVWAWVVQHAIVDPLSL